MPVQQVVKRSFFGADPGSVFADNREHDRYRIRQDFKRWFDERLLISFVDLDDSASEALDPAKPE